jgi:hypothetical protein
MLSSHIAVERLQAGAARAVPPPPRQPHAKHSEQDVSRRASRLLIAIAAAVPPCPHAFVLVRRARRLRASSRVIAVVVSSTGMAWCGRVVVLLEVCWAARNLCQRCGGSEAARGQAG